MIKNESAEQQLDFVVSNNGLLPVGKAPLPGDVSFTLPARQSIAMPHKLFLFYLDDTLLDYKKSEQTSFALAMEEVGFNVSVWATHLEPRCIT